MTTNNAALAQSDCLKLVADWPDEPNHCLGGSIEHLVCHAETMRHDPKRDQALQNDATISHRPRLACADLVSQEWRRRSK